MLFLQLTQLYPQIITLFLLFTWLLIVRSIAWVMSRVRLLLDFKFVNLFLVGFQLLLELLNPFNLLIIWVTRVTGKHGVVCHAFQKTAFIYILEFTQVRQQIDIIQFCNHRWVHLYLVNKLRTTSVKRNWWIACTPSMLRPVFAFLNNNFRS